MDHDNDNNNNNNDPFGSGDATQDTTGLGIWAASLVMAQWMMAVASADNERSSLFHDKSVLELGAGCGVPGLAVACCCGHAKQVYLTDLNPITVRNLEYNIGLNKTNLKCLVEAKRMDWADESTWPQHHQQDQDSSSFSKVDVVIGSDLVYQASMVPLLKRVILGLLKNAKNEGRFLYCAPDTGRDGLDEFIEAMSGSSSSTSEDDGRCRLIRQMQAPREYHSNPLSSGDDDECFLHFHELASTTYILYEFGIMPS